MVWQLRHHSADHPLLRNDLLLLRLLASDRAEKSWWTALVHFPLKPWVSTLSFLAVLAWVRPIRPLDAIRSFERYENISKSKSIDLKPRTDHGLLAPMKLFALTRVLVEEHALRRSDDMGHVYISRLCILELRRI